MKKLFCYAIIFFIPFTLFARAQTSNPDYKALQVLNHVMLQIGNSMYVLKDNNLKESDLSYEQGRLDGLQSVLLEFQEKYPEYFNDYGS